MAVWAVVKGVSAWIGSLAYLDPDFFASCVSSWVRTKVLFVL